MAHDHSECGNHISKDKLDHYFDITGQAIKKVKLAEAKYVKVHFSKAAEDFFDMAKRYFEDAEHFREKGDVVNAFAALNYAHGWLDAGARLGLFDVDGDNRLFTVDKESMNIFQVADDDSEEKIYTEEDYDSDVEEEKPKKKDDLDEEDEDPDPYGLRD